MENGYVILQLIYMTLFICKPYLQWILKSTTMPASLYILINANLPFKIFQGLYIVNYVKILKTLIRDCIYIYVKRVWKGKTDQRPNIWKGEWKGKTLIRLHGCPGWYESSLFAHPVRYIFHVPPIIHTYYIAYHQSIKNSAAKLTNKIISENNMGV